MKYLMFILFASLTTLAKSQAHLIATIEYKDTTYTIKTSDAKVALNFRTGTLQLSAYLNSFSCSVKAVNNYLDSIGGKFLYNANINQDEFKFIQEENQEQLMPLQGIVLLNNREKGVIGNYKLFKLNNSREDEEKNIRITLLFDIEPEDFNITNQLPLLVKPIRFELVEALIVRMD